MTSTDSRSQFCSDKLLSMLQGSLRGYKEDCRHGHSVMGVETRSARTLARRREAACSAHGTCAYTDRVCGLGRWLPD